MKNVVDKIINIKENYNKEGFIIFLLSLLFLSQFFLILLYFWIGFNISVIRIISTIIVIFITFLLLYIVIYKKEKIKYFTFFIFNFLLYIYFLQPLFLDNLFRIFINIHFIILVYLYFKKIKINNKNINLKNIDAKKTNLKNYFKKENLLIIFVLTWLIYSFISVIWAQNKTRVFIRIEFIFYAFLIVSFGFYYQKKYNLLKNLNYIFIFVFIISITIGLFEVYSGKHLPSARPSRYINMKRFIPASVYWNENDFATFIALFIIFPLFFILDNSLLFKLRHKKIAILLDFSIKVILFTTIIFSIKELLKTDSRANILALILFFTIFIPGIIIYLFNKIKKTKIKIIFLFFIFLTLFSGYLIISKNKNKISFLNKINKTIQNIKSKKIYRDSSIYIRINLIKNGLRMLKDSKYIGVGAGNTEVKMPEYSKKYFKTYGITNIHNFWMELLVDYGIFIFIIFLLYYLYTIFILIKYFILMIKLKNNPDFSNNRSKRNKKSVNKSSENNKDLFDKENFGYQIMGNKIVNKNLNFNIIKIIIILSSVISFSLASVSTSSLLTRPMVWIYFSYISIYLNWISYNFLYKPPFLSKVS